MTRSTLGRAAVPAALVLSLSVAACSASNESSSPGGASSSAGAASSAPASTGASSAPASSGPESSAPASSAAPSSPSGNSAPLSGTLAGAGSTAQTAAMTAWIAGFQQASSGVTVNYASVGSGGGVSQFLSGGVAFAGSDAYLADDELTQSKKTCGGATAIDIPTYISPIAVAYNLPSVKNLKLDPTTLAMIMQGKIKTWDDAAIKKTNPGASLPSTTITAVHRSDKSGTTKNFTDYLHQAAPSVWTDEAAEIWPVSGGEAANGTSGVVAAIKGGEGTIGYADASQAGGLGEAQVKVGSGYTGPTAAGAAATVDASKPATGRPKGDLAFTIDRTTTTKGAYPVILVSYEVVCTKYSNAQNGNLVKGLVKYIISAEGQQAAAKAAGSAPISDTLRTKDMASLAMISVGG